MRKFHAKAVPFFNDYLVKIEALGSVSLRGFLRVHHTGRNSMTDVQDGNGPEDRDETANELEKSPSKLWRE